MKLRRNVPLLLVGVALCLLAAQLLNSTLSGRTSPAHQAPIVTLASSHVRLRSELIPALQSLYAQTVKPEQIRLYFPLEDREQVLAAIQGPFETLRLFGSTPKPRYNEFSDKEIARTLTHPLLKIEFVKDAGPATKFVYAIDELLKAGQLYKPLIVLDDDHSYSSSLVYTLLTAHRARPDISVGLRGWRVRNDLEWGVAWSEYDRHVIQGYSLQEAYRVGVLTANEGYLILPKWFEALPLGLERASGESKSIELVDDILMAGVLSKQHIPRFVVPLQPAPSFSYLLRHPLSFLSRAPVPSVDITVSHALEGRITAAGSSRAEANAVSLRHFKSAWDAEGYRYEPLEGEKGEDKTMPADWAEPVRAIWAATGVSELLRWLETRKLRSRFDEPPF